MRARPISVRLLVRSRFDCSSDLGSIACSQRPSCKERAFGVPTIRTDLPARSAGQKSVADNSNYGGEPAAISLIFPSGGADRGVVEAGAYTPPLLTST